MRRREFLAGLGAAALAAPAVPAFQAPSGAGKLKIAAVEVWQYDGSRQAETGVNNQYQVNPLHVYEELRPKPYRDSATPGSRTARVSALYLKIRTDQGLEGLYGPIDREAAIVVLEQLRGFLLGKDPLAGETLWDQMYRSNRHSRSGTFMMAISAVDNALWDLRGRFFNAPVYRLLGGPTRGSVEVYASCLGYSLEPEAMHKRAQQFKAEGFRNEKWFMGYGPGDGPEGLKKNVEMIRILRDAVGDDVELMFDAYSGWDLNYAIDWARQVERYRPRWIEEAFHPEKIESFAALRKAISFPVASGEHFYGRWEVERYLAASALHVVQADPEWCGGVSELVKICTVCSLHDVQVIPHGHSIHAALHVVASQSPMTCPLVEDLLLKMTSYYHFEKDPPKLERAHFALPTRPGFGIELDSGKAEKTTELKIG
jgi:L-alanine-DL-glutamate epimerase-like enolase superfamily enzyme